MRIYLAAVYTSNIGLKSQIYLRMDPVEQAARREIRYILESYHYVGTQISVDRMREDKCRIFLDSGAFSAFTLGQKIDIDAYIRYIQRNGDIIEYASVLDGIGDPQLTYDNQCYMEAKGTHPLPCFHYGEDERWLEYYISRYDYITLGGMVPIGRPQLLLWLDRIWERYLVDGAGYPRVKVHGFGLNAYPLMERYPWYSVDASSWQQQGSNGNIIIPWHDGILYFPISNNSSFAKKDWAHLNTVPRPQQEVIEAEVSRRGFDLARVKQWYFSRWSFNFKSFFEMNDELTHRWNQPYHAQQYNIF